MKNSHLCRGSNSCQQASTQVTGVNVTIIMKDWKAKKVLSQVECYNCYKKGHYTNKCPDKQPKLVLVLVISILITKPSMELSKSLNPVLVPVSNSKPEL